MLGDEPRFASVPVLLDFSCACHVCAPVLDVAVAPGPPPAVDGALQPLGTTSVIEPPCMPPVPAVYVKVIVRPVCDAETLLIELPNVPEPSVESGGISATRWATQFVDAEAVAVLFPDAPADACVPSAPVARALL